MWKGNQSTKVNDFIARRFIGSGHYSIVYEVELKGDFNPKRIYAFKRTFLKNEEIIKRILQERKVLEMIITDERTKNSPFLPTLYAAFLTSSKSVAMVMPAGSGADLCTLWQHYCPFSEEEVLFYAAEILCGLEALHALRIVHVDLKSSNVIIMPSGHVMIIDFDHSLDISSGPRQHSNKYFGTEIYRPSEVANGTLISEKSDIWCWAMILLELLCENCYFLEVALYAVRKDKKNLHLYVRCSKTLMNLLLWCFHECPEDRPCLSAIKQHDFFRGLKWEDVESCKLQPPGRLDASKCYRDPRELDPLILKNLKEAEMINLDIGITNQNGSLIRYGWRKQDEKCLPLNDELKSNLEKFDFVHPDEFKNTLEEEMKRMEEGEKTSKFCSSC